ncbi:Bis-tetraphosphatase [Podospora australis]|uniref:Bis(5'-adenosyl)-triphosphatase n=1 Tax=Podospora australis TaxID=1536484 RepID=A0AAN7APJ5_9PEZI|nr:Bis-tetraphosphatase [Podospora australis]
MASSPSAPKDMTTTTQEKPIFFGPFEVTSQVFLKTPSTFALVNLKPLLPGHVLICPLAPHRRLTDLSSPELVDLWETVQVVQRMLARYYFSPSPSSSPSERCELGSFNIAVQDGPEAGQTVPHVHVHVIPRIKGSTAKSVETPSDELYERMAAEDGNVGGALWDRLILKKRPEPSGRFPAIEDADRKARDLKDMQDEAGIYRGILKEMGEEEGDSGE